jgi:ATP-dependent DNA helicase RecQ
MQEYVDLPFGSHMSFLLGALDGDTGDTSFPTLPELQIAPNVETVIAANVFLNRTNVEIRVRKQWPTSNSLRSIPRGNIPSNQRAEQGMALCYWGDAGWGSRVLEGKYGQRHFADDLVDACVQMIHDWEPEPTPTWVTAVPSLEHPTLVPDFARRLATKLGLPFIPALTQITKRPQQKTMENSAFQASNVFETLDVGATALPTGPVFLVDDVVDSGWTMTVAAWKLRSKGINAVWPIALAVAGAGL